MTDQTHVMRGLTPPVGTHSEGRADQAVPQIDGSGTIFATLLAHSLPGSPEGGFPTQASEHSASGAYERWPILFPGYEIIQEVGRGGMGVVYQARHYKLNRLVALKVILAGPHASSEDRARFHIEAEAGARLRHPNILQVYDVGDHSGFAYMAQEFVPGGTLRQWQDGKPQESRLAARIGLELARAIQHAHEMGIIHRDIKPANILLSNTPDSPVPTQRLIAPKSGSGVGAGVRDEALAFTLKVGDFGLAKALEGGANLTLTGVACGTPNYMAPEQIRSGEPVGPATDVYGIGAVLYELLTGRPPFVGTDAAEVMTNILRTEPSGVRRFAPSTPRDLTVIVAKCLEKDPTRRYPSACELAEDLDRYLAGRPILARHVSQLLPGR